MNGLSILIPEYKDNVVEQVRLLKEQCEAACNSFSEGHKSLPCKGIGLDKWEIIVADDGTPIEEAMINAAINEIEGCRLIIRGKNYGRSSTRNFLAREAKYNTLLYIDSGLKPNPHFVEKYVENIGKSLVVCGNIEVDTSHIDMTNLRCKNELKAQKRFTAAKHSQEPYKNFHTTAFMIDRQTMLNNPMREDIKTYGYEDTLFGKMLSEKQISILHIDNPVLFVRFESNERFLEKTREGIYTLYVYRNDLDGYSPLLHLVNNLKKWHLLRMIKLMHRCLGSFMERNLKGNNPSLKVFNLYRVCLLAEKDNNTSLL